MAGVAGCLSDDDDEEAPPEPDDEDLDDQDDEDDDVDPDDDPEDDDEEEPDDEETDVVEPDPEEEPEEEVEEEEEIEELEDPTVTVEVEYDGEWMGVIETTDTRNEHEGEGSETFDVELDPEYDIVTAWFQKMVSGDDSREITVRVVIDEEVVIEETVAGEYGMVRVQVEVG